MRNWRWGILLFLGVVIAGFVFAVFIKQPPVPDREVTVEPNGLQMEQEYAIQRTITLEPSPVDTLSLRESLSPAITTYVPESLQPSVTSGDLADATATENSTLSTELPNPESNSRSSVTQDTIPPGDPVDDPTEILARRIRARADSVLTPETSDLLSPDISWPDSSRTRRPLTPEIAAQFPADYPSGRRMENSVWHVGERLDFTLDYGIVNAGTATMRVLGTELVNGAVCYHIESTANSNSVISAFYKVRDVVTTYIDTTGVFSRRFEKKLREGGYKSDRSVDFYMDRRLALNTREKYALLTIPSYVQDILSAFYYMRLFDLEVGRDEFIDVYSDGKVYPLRVIVHGIETVTVGAGKFTCFKIEPMLESEGLFRQEGQLFIWLTQDERRLPVKMTSKIAIGSIGANLDKYTLGN